MAPDINSSYSQLLYCCLLTLYHIIVCRSCNTAPWIPIKPIKWYKMPSGTNYSRRTPWILIVFPLKTWNWDPEGKGLSSNFQASFFRGELLNFRGVNQKTSPLNFPFRQHRGILLCSCLDLNPWPSFSLQLHPHLCQNLSVNRFWGKSVENPSVSPGMSSLVENVASTIRVGGPKTTSSSSSKRSSMGFNLF